MTVYYTGKKRIWSKQKFLVWGEDVIIMMGASIAAFANGIYVSIWLQSLIYFSASSFSMFSSESYGESKFIEYQNAAS
jgi:hypothetical protein